MIVTYTDEQVAAMSLDRCRELSAEIKTTMIASDNPQHRRDTLNLLRRLDARVSKAPATVEQRAATARDFLNPPAATESTKAKVWAMACELHGGAKNAARAGYVDPGGRAA